MAAYSITQSNSQQSERRGNKLYLMSTDANAVILLCTVLCSPFRAHLHRGYCARERIRERERNTCNGVHKFIIGNDTRKLSLGIYGTVFSFEHMAIVPRILFAFPLTACTTWIVHRNVCEGKITVRNYGYVWTKRNHPCLCLWKFHCLNETFCYASFIHWHRIYNLVCVCVWLTIGPSCSQSAAHVCMALAAEHYALSCIF